MLLREMTVLQREFAQKAEELQSVLTAKERELDSSRCAAERAEQQLSTTIQELDEVCRKYLIPALGRSFESPRGSEWIACPKGGFLVGS